MYQIHQKISSLRVLFWNALRWNSIDLLQLLISLRIRKYIYRHRGFQGSAASYAERSTLNKGESNSRPDVGEGVWVALFLLDANFFCQLFHDSTC